MSNPTDEIIRAMPTSSATDAAAIQKAYDFAEVAHGNEKRKSGEPYINHPRAIAIELAKLGMDRDTIIAGILHDTVEDTPVTPEEIEEKFGPTVRFLVDGVTKLSKLKYQGLERHVESLRRLLVATANDIRVIIIKLADRLHNMQTIEFVAPEKQRRIASETMEIYVPIAERLGMSAVKSELQDLSYAVLDPEGYKATLKTLEAKREEMEKGLSETLKDLKRALGEAGIRNFQTEMRVKGTYSFAKKLEEKEGNIERVYDLFALRAIVPTVGDCYRLLGLVHGLWRPVLGRVKDYIAVPKPNGYRSIHTTVITGNGVIVEVQIRTEEMHRESQYGIASHFNYEGMGKKQTSSVNWIRSLLPSLKKRAEKTGDPQVTVPSWLKDLTEIDAENPDHEAFQEALHEDFFAERMFTFTPKGDVIDLPVGATPADFAYAVHTSVLDSMMGARVNGKMVSLDTPLKNGDKVEIVTKKGGKPNKKWLDMVKTTRAKRHIRNALKKGDKN